MKKILVFCIAFMLAVNLFAAKKTAPLTPEQQAGKMYAERNAVTETAKALENADRCITAYKKLFEQSPSDRVLFGYIEAIDFKYDNLIKDVEEKKQSYKAMIPVMDRFCEDNPGSASSNYILYSYMTLWGRCGELVDLMEAAASGIAGKIKDNADRIYASDKTFKNWAASYALGRMHYKVPNIVFVLTWPDKNMSKKYLEEYTAANPGEPMGKYYLADTLWDLGDREKAAALYREVMNTPPRPAEYYEDTKAIAQCRERAKEQGIE